MAMLGDLEHGRSESGRRHYIWEGPKIAGVLREPSPFPKWMADFFSVPTRARVERVIRIITAVLDGRECSLNCRDRDLYEYMKEWAAGNVPRYYGELFDQVPKPEGTPA